MTSSKQKFTEAQWALIALTIGVLSGMVGYFWPKEPQYSREYTVEPLPKTDIADPYLYGSFLEGES